MASFDPALEPEAVARSAILNPVSANPQKTLWKVNGSPIHPADIRTEAALIRQQAEQRGAQLGMEDRLALPHLALERLIERAILRTSAHRLGFTPSEQEVQTSLARLAPRNDGVSGCRAGIASEETLADLRQRLAVDKLMTSCLAKVKRPQAWQIGEYYRKNTREFWTPALAHVSHLVKNFDDSGACDESQVRSAAHSMHERVLQGHNFADVAKQDSDCPEHWGDLGYFARGAMVEEFDAVVFAAPLAALTPVFRTRFGYHTAIVHDRKPEGIRALEEVELEIAEILQRQAQDHACGELLTRLRKNARIEQAVE